MPCGISHSLYTQRLNAFEYPPNLNPHSLPITIKQRFTIYILAKSYKQLVGKFSGLRLSTKAIEVTELLGHQGLLDAAELLQRLPSKGVERPSGRRGRGADGARPGGPRGNRWMVQHRQGEMVRIHRQGVSFWWLSFVTMD